MNVNFNSLLIAQEAEISGSTELSASAETLNL